MTVNYFVTNRGVAGERMLSALKPAAFALECHRIVTTMRGHEAHRALDLLTNHVLDSLGYGEGIAIFEAAVAHWHDAADPYPYVGPCPDCMTSRTTSTAAARQINRQKEPRI